MRVCVPSTRGWAGRGVSGSMRLGEAEEGMCGKSQLSAAQLACLVC